MKYIGSLIYVCPLLFLAGIVDGAVGGGGLIAFPTYMLTGMPMHFAYGCNKLQSFAGTTGALLKYRKNGLVDLKIAAISAFSAIIGSFVATRLVLLFDDAKIRLIVVILIPFVPVLLFVRQKMNRGSVNAVKLNVKSVVSGLTVGLVIGLYDGIFGPGSGTMAMIIYSVIMGYDMRVGCGNGKIVVAASNLMALVNYIVSGNVIYVVAIPAAFFNTAGCVLGAELSVRFGKKVIMPLMIFVVAFLFVQTIFRLLS